MPKRQPKVVRKDRLTPYKKIATKSIYKIPSNSTSTHPIIEMHKGHGTIQKKEHGLQPKKYQSVSVMTTKQNNVTYVYYCNFKVTYNESWGLMM